MYCRTYYLCLLFVDHIAYNFDGAEHLVSSSGLWFGLHAYVPDGMSLTILQRQRMPANGKILDDGSPKFGSSNLNDIVLNGT